MTNQPPRSSGIQINPVVLVLGSFACVLLLIITGLLIYIMIGGKGPPPDDSGNKIVVKAGETAKKTDSKSPPPAPRKVDEDRITGAVRVGKTYEMILKGDAKFRGRNKEWGMTTVVFMQWVFECACDRTIESNDGSKVVEIREFKRVRSALVESKVENVSFDFGLPGVLVLGCLDQYLPGTSLAFESILPLASEVVRGAIQSNLDEKAKIEARVDSLAGKKIRLLFENGKGVTEIQPIGCDLTEADREFLLSTAVIGDVFLVPHLKAKVGSGWSVDAANLAGLVDPALRGKTNGYFSVQREQDVVAAGRNTAQLRISGGGVKIDSSTSEQTNIGTFTPKGTMFFDLDDQYVTKVDLTGDIDFKSVSKNHILFETRFDSKPDVKISYSCKMR